MFPRVTDADGWAVERRGSLVLVTFAGNLVEAQGRDSATRCVELMGDDRIHLAADFLELERYEGRVRTAWQDALFPRRKQLRGVIVGAKKPLVRMGVTAFGLFVGLPVEVVDSRRALEQRVGDLS